MRKSKVTTVLLPPAVATALVILFSGWVFWNDVTSPPRFIDGRVDNAPRNAAVVMFILTPFLFAVLLACQALAIKLSRGRFARLLAVYVGGILLVFGGIILLTFLSGDQPSKATEGFALFVFLGLCLSIPMALTTWWAFRRQIDQGSEGRSA